MTPTFHEELAVYYANLIDLLAYAGRYVTIRGKDIQGPFESLEQASRVGRIQYGAGPFLVKQILGEPATSRPAVASPARLPA
jgi:hypothetical protein